MVLLARSRQRSAALAQYEACRRVLARELSVEPMPETTALYEQLKSAAAPPPHNLPPQPTAFVGRAAELAEIARFLNNPSAPAAHSGGLGRHRQDAPGAAGRRALRGAGGQLRRALCRWRVRGPAGRAWPGRRPGETQPSLMAAMADALHFDFQGPVHPQAQLLSHLRDKRMLLVLDNFEHLVAEARQLGDILRLAPGIKLLVTSRARLSLQEEWLLELAGLDYPAGASALPPTRAADSTAPSRLFVQQARRVRPGFVLSRQRAGGGAHLPAGRRACRWPSSWPPVGCACCRGPKSWPSWSRGWTF